jgi:pilus assembly protein Flp/PilA
MIQLFGARLAMVLSSLQNLEVPSPKREEGQTLAEYALILALIAVVVVGVVFALGGTIKGIFTSVNNSI